MLRSRKLLALVRSRADQQAPLERVASAAGYELELTETTPLAAASLRRTPPAVLLVEANARGAEDLCQKARLGRDPGDLCVLVAARKLNDVAFAKAFQWGADDLVHAEAERALTQRLLRLPKDATSSPPERGMALVADPRPMQAARLARVLGHAGYAAQVAHDVDSALQLAFSEACVLIVATQDFGPPAEVVALAREAGSRACFVWLIDPADLAVEERLLQTFARTAVVSSAEPPEAALFVSNEILGRDRQHGRIEARLLFGTVVAFRAAGSDEDDFGFTYNISPHGLYIRTLAPPDEDQVWMELRPPADRRRVRLAGSIAWRYGFGRLGTATAPPGFGVRISAGLCSDHTSWIEGYDALFSQVEAAARFQPSERAIPSEAPPIRPVSSRPAPPRPASSRPPAARAASSRPPPAAVGAAPGPAMISQPVVIVRTEEPATDSGTAAEVSPNVAPPEVQPPTEPRAHEPIPTADSQRTGPLEPALDQDNRPLAPPRKSRFRTVARRAVPGLVVGTLFMLGLVYYAGRRSTSGREPDAARSLPLPAVSRSDAPLEAPVLMRPASAELEITPPASTRNDATEASPAPSHETVAAPIPSADGSALPFSRGYLWVRSTVDATVFVNGIATGKINSLLDVPCGWRFVRLGTEPGPRWLGPGHTVDVICRGFTSVSIQP
jgi:hypothetical protein